MTTTDNYFDIVTILRYEIFGNDALMILTFACLLAFLMAKYQVPFEVWTIVGVLYAFIVWLLLPGWTIFYVLAVAGSALLYYFMYYRRMQ